MSDFRRLLSYLGRYRIDMVQTVEGIYPPSQDLTLARYEQIPEEVTGDELE